MFEVTNQPPPLEPYNLFGSDTVLREAVAREGAGWAGKDLSALGATLGEPETIQAGFAANKNPPVLRTLDRYGHRLDEVEFHPSWHMLLGLAVKAGLHSSPWAEPKPGAHVARAAGTYMLTQIESGVYCPLAMTYGSVPTLRHAPEIAKQWLPKIFGRDYDRRLRSGQGKDRGAARHGHDREPGRLRSAHQYHARRARGRRVVPPAPGTNGSCRRRCAMPFWCWRKVPRACRCFLLPRWTPDGERNAIRILRLKDKLGNKSNASSEVEFDGAFAQLIGEEGRGIPTIIEMGNYTRLDCCIGSSGLMRQAVAQAVHHARHRTVFQKKLIDQPLMTNVLADLALECEAATALTFRLARAYDETTRVRLALRRAVTPAAKFWICKRAPALTYEAMEVLGGSGYIEESVMPRLYREAPVNSIWEGSGNIMCLDVLRAIGRTDNIGEVLRRELDDGGDARLKSFTARLLEQLAAPDLNDEAQARVLTRDLVLALQGALLLKHSPPAVADAFCASRLARRGRLGVRHAAARRRHADDRDARSARDVVLLSCPALCRASTPYFFGKTWMAGTSPAMTKLHRAENGKCQSHLRRKAGDESQRAQPRDARRIDDHVNEPRPEKHRAGHHGICSRDMYGVEDQHQHRKHHEIFHGVVMGRLQAVCPGRLRFELRRRIRHRAHQPAHHGAVKDVGDPQNPGEDCRIGQPLQFTRHWSSPAQGIWRRKLSRCGDHCRGWPRSRTRQSCTLT